MEKLRVLVGCLLLVSIIGCGTIKGMGEDIGAIGGWLQKGSENVKENAR